MKNTERGKSLKCALEIINGNRLDQYGTPENSFETIADHWNATLKQLITNRMIESSVLIPDDMQHQIVSVLSNLLTPLNVAQLMILYKHSRQLTGAGKVDNYDDQAGYVGLAGDIFRETIFETETVSLEVDTQKKTGVVR
jgi:Mg-chelatase subunit ChlI